MNYTIHNGNSAEILKQYPDNHFDSIVTDPPYLIDFLGKAWDAADNKQLDVYTECFRVLKPGGYILAFSAARTYHHLAITLEQAGFEIRDQLMWLYSSGFPKSMAVKGHEGWKTALKPAHEPIAMARKPFKGSTIDNMNTWGVGALNIDESRVGFERVQINEYTDAHYVTPGDSKMNGADYDSSEVEGRYPSNVIGEVKGYQKFYYCPKVSRKERHIGHELPEPYDRREEGLESAGIQGIQKLNGEKNSQGGNNHPTVKPVELMKYLIKLVTPPNSAVLDPFNGSGSTGMAATELGHTYIGCELDPDYVEITKKRIEAWNNPKYDNMFEELFNYDV